MISCFIILFLFLFLLNKPYTILGRHVIVQQEQKHKKIYLYVVLHHQIAPVAGNYQRFATAGVTRIHINLAISQVIRKQQY